MENPHSAHQAQLLERICNSVEKLNDVTRSIHNNLVGLNEYAEELRYISEVWARHSRNMDFTLQTNAPKL